ncbi:MAG: hypothetical protein CTY33_08670 [Methylotenera sp.]|jgi:hypothetical protein|nr:MAG: hypothetical protein CTY33_08670 [Methylotenera sp.]
MRRTDTMKTSILISSLVSIIFAAPIVSANEMTLGTVPHSIRISANAHELLSVQPSSQVIVSDFHLAMMDEMEDMDKMNDKGKMKNKDGKAKKGVGKKGTAQPSGKKSAPVDSNPPSTEMSNTPAPMTESPPMSDM